MSERIVPPWTDEQVAALNWWQQNDRLHPFTCPGDSPECVDRSLIATMEGWVCACGKYRQRGSDVTFSDLVEDDVETIMHALVVAYDDIDRYRGWMEVIAAIARDGKVAALADKALQGEPVPDADGETTDG